MPESEKTIPARGPASVRRRRFWFLLAAGHGARAALLVTAIGGLVLGWLALDPARSAQLQQKLATRLTAGPQALLREAEQAFIKEDYPAAARAARQFTASIPLPLPVDALGENYRTALRILRASAEKSGDLPTQLAAGRMAQAFDPRDTAALFDYARALRASGDGTGATAVFESAFAIRPFSAAIAQSLESIYSDTGQPAKQAAVHARHLEAVALCLNLPAWQAGSLVYYDGAGSTALDVRLVFPQPTEITLPFQRPPDGVYLVFKSLPHLRIMVESAFLVDPKHGHVPLGLEPQQALSRGDNPTTVVSRIVSGAAGLDAPAVLGLVQKIKPTPGATLHLTLRVEPDAELEPWVRQYGTWHHPRVPVAAAPGN